MAIQILYQADVCLSGIAGSTEFTRIKLTLDVPTKDKTTFQSTARCYVPGVYTASAQGEFLYQSGASNILNLIEPDSDGPTPGVYTPQVLTIGADLNAGSIVNIWRGAFASLSEVADYGEIVKATIDTQPAERNVQSTRLIRATGAVTGTSGTGTAQLIGALVAGQSLYSALHVLGTTGGAAGTIFSIISSATSSLTAPTTRVTFVAGTSQVAGEWGTPAAGAITDTWWAFKWTGYTGTGCTVSCAAGIQ